MPRSTPTSSVAARRLPYPELSVPLPAVPSTRVDGRQPNSSLFTEGARAGGSYLFDGGFAGIAISRFASDYHMPQSSMGRRA